MAPNIFSMLIDGINSRIAQWAYGSRNREEKAERTQRYYKGVQDAQLKITKGFDDNLITNYSRLVIDRGVSMLMGHGVDFFPPGETTTAMVNGKKVKKVNPAKEWLDLCWEANKKDIVLHNIAKTGGIFGTAFVKIQPEGIEYKGSLYPRLVVQNPKYWQVFTQPEDLERVIRYRMEFNAEENGKDVTRREDFDLEENTWYLREYVDRGSGQFVLLDEQVIPYEFPLIHHWQNLPQFDSVYGEPDLTDDILVLQDRINFMSSNISKIIRLHAHPKVFGVGMGNGKTVSFGPDDMPLLPEGADMRQLAYVNDLSSASNYLLSLRQSMFDITRTVDISSMSDKLGALTNFGLHVLYQDALSKLETKQALYGEGLEEINRRLLTIAGLNDDPGEVEFGDALPENTVETVNAEKAMMDMGIQSKQGASQSLGIEYEETQAEIDESKANEKSFGQNLLDNFMRTGNVVNNPAVNQPVQK
jgi:hypothetical protein